MPTITRTPLTTPPIGTAPVPGSEVYLPASPVLVKVFDDSAGTFTDLTTEANNAAANDVPLLPDPLGSNDIVYIGNERKFDTVLINMGIAGAGTYGSIWQYHNSSAWTALTLLYDSDNATDAFRVSGHFALFLEPPGDIARQIIDSQSAFWIRMLIQGAGAGYTQPVATQMWMRLLFAAAAAQIPVQII